MQVEIVDLSTVKGVKDHLCYGVARTVEMAEKKAQSYQTDKPLFVDFHLPGGANQEHRERTQKTIQRLFGSLASDVVLVDQLKNVPDGASYLIGTRGVSPKEREEAQRRLELVLDTTCPYVTSQEAAARKLLEEGYELVFCGLAEYHGIPRLHGIAEQFGKQVLIAQRPADVEKLPFKRSTRVGVILQTTWHMSLTRDVIAELVSRFREVRVIDTSCIDSLGRVPAARKLAQESDVVIVVDPGNTTRFLEEEIKDLAHRPGAPQNIRVHRTKGRQELKPEWFAGVEKVGVIGGVSVHTLLLEDVADGILELAKQSQPAM